MVVVAFLRQTHFVFEAQNLRAVLAHLAVHVVGAFQDLRDPVGKCIHDLRMVVQVSRLDELDPRMAGCDLIGVVIDALDQDAREQEIREDDDPLVAHPRAVLQRRFDQREGNAGIAHFAPAKAHAFPKHAHHFSDVGIGIRVRRAAPDDTQQRVMPGDLIIQGFFDPGACGSQHLQINGKFPTILDRHTGVLRLIRVQDGRNIILRVAGGEQHARNRQNAGHTLFTQLI